MLNTIKTKFSDFWEVFSTSMQFNKQLHGWLTVIWFAAAFPIAIYLSTSVPFLVFISVYAVVVSHWNLWFSTKIEKKHEENPVEEAIIDRLDKHTDITVDSTTTEETTISTEKD